MARPIRSGAIIALCLALLLAGCATKQETGMAGGAAAGALAGSAVGGRYQGLAIVGGALVGAVVGGLIGKALDDADRRKAEQAAASAANDGRRIIWSSDKTPGVRGYAEPVGPTYRMPAPGAAPGPQIRCLDKDLGVAYSVGADQRCTGSDRVLSEAEFVEHQRAKGTAVPPEPTVAPATPQTASTPAAATSCRKVREVVIIDGTEKKEETQYCLRGGAWARA